MIKVSNGIRGEFYPTSLTAKCPMYSGCIVTGKCQNFDKHSLVCTTCESRCRPALMLGGILAEGEFEPDIQLAVKTIRDVMNSPMMKEDSDGTKMSVDMVEDKRLQEASNQLNDFSSRIKITEEETSHLVADSIAQNLSDLKY